jgi:hypothetical protein
MGEYEVKSWVPDYVMVEGPKRIWEKKTFIETLPVSKDLTRSEETVTVSLNMEGLQASRIKPDTVKVVLKRHGGKKPLRN